MLLCCDTFRTFTQAPADGIPSLPLPPASKRRDFLSELDAVWEDLDETDGGSLDFEETEDAFDYFEEFSGRLKLRLMPMKPSAVPPPPPPPPGSPPPPQGKRPKSSS